MDNINRFPGFPGYGYSGGGSAGGPNDPSRGSSGAGGHSGCNCGCHSSGSAGGQTTFQLSQYDTQPYYNMRLAILNMAKDIGKMNGDYKTGSIIAIADQLTKWLYQIK